MKKFILALMALSTTVFISSCTVRSTTYDTTRTIYVGPSPVVYGYPSRSYWGPTYYRRSASYWGPTYYRRPAYQRRSSVWFNF